jgi:hypothetical protein
MPWQRVCISELTLVLWLQDAVPLVWIIYLRPMFFAGEFPPFRPSASTLLTLAFFMQVPYSR